MDEINASVFASRYLTVLPDAGALMVGLGVCGSRDLRRRRFQFRVAPSVFKRARSMPCALERAAVEQTIPGEGHNA